MIKKKITGIILASSLALGLSSPIAEASVDTSSTTGSQGLVAEPPGGINWQLYSTSEYWDDGYWVVGKWYKYKKTNGKIARKHESYIYKDSSKKHWIGFSYQTYGL